MSQAAPRGAAVSPAAARLSKRKLAAELEVARSRIRDVLAAVPDDELRREHSPLMSPLVWDLAHCAHFKELWLVRALGGQSSGDARLDELYDAFAHERFERAALELLSPVEARRYADDVHARALAVLARTDADGNPLLRGGFVYGMVVQHEHQHVETMLATLQLREAPYPAVDAPAPPARTLERREVFVEAGPFLMGTSEADEPWSYDNEQRAHEVELPAFWIDTLPVTNAAYAEFVEAGGYSDSRHWTDEGWAWRREAALEQPEFWRRERDGWSRRRFGRWEPLPPGEPVQHVCWYEADAYARSVGKRLPTEAEWEKAASWSPADQKRRYPWGDEPPGPEHANVAARRFAPSPAGAYPAGVSAYGVEQLIGDVWEWTASNFKPYPGFEAFPYREYSEVFFGDQYKVLRGGSWATHPLAIRSTFRNWDFPIRRQIFAGFRCARDA